MSGETTSVPARQLLRAAIDERRARLLLTVAGVRAVERVAERFTRVRLQGDGLRAYRDARPADAFKLHLPSAPHAPVPLPTYDERGRARWPAAVGRPATRPFTVVDADPQAGTLAFDVLSQPGGATAGWLDGAMVGDRVSLTGMRTDFVDCDAAEHLLLVGDASALPAVAAIIRSVPARKRLTAVVDLDAADLPLLPAHPRLDVVGAAPGTLAEALRDVALGMPTQVWIGAESEAVRRARRVVLDELRVHPDALHASGYWKRGSDGDAHFDASLERFNVARDAGRDVGDPGLLQQLAFE
ncbi:siderophore-interacting protein [Conexibacter woesei]|uniref:Siderophore-interacting protein n=1 Tax=Conexibacter woesei (strain DSM 14684 / CCUG 47730 / CIP 108061 / JCM 11494 / NBRC 100937 / ID131577) TaxID=469383 RepID=D3F5H8_CONWI|nr:siderophore-interacting protein [Conexibacter woesei]ADB50645.1 Siderophore-interacting protein [Conexibacter woesei DSM 14684]